MEEDTSKNYDSVKWHSKFLQQFVLNQIPGDSDSTKGNKERGIFWTNQEKEVSRDISINEKLIHRICKDFEHTYFKEVYDILSSKFKLGRVSTLLKEMCGVGIDISNQDYICLS